MACNKTVTVLFGALLCGTAIPTLAASSVQVGDSGRSFASSAVSCAVNSATGLSSPTVQAGLFNPRLLSRGTVSLNGAPVGTVNLKTPALNLWLAEGSNTVTVSPDRWTTDRFEFTVAPMQCQLPDTSGNTHSPDGTLEYGANGLSYATVAPGCAMNPATGMTQPFINLFNNGTWLLNVSVNNTPLTQLNGTNRTHTPVFLAAGTNVISTALSSGTTDYYVRDGGIGSCTLP